MTSATRHLLHGEINDVLNDVRAIVNDDESLEQEILPALRDYNLAQFITVDVPGTSHQVCKITPSRRERFLDPRSKTSFKFDHLRLEATDSRPEESDIDVEPLRAALESSALAYISAHYHDGVVAVFSVQLHNQFIVQIVANKYNPSNYWSGRWRSQYYIDFDSKMIEGKVLVNVHYYEQGNVQLETSHDLTIPIPAAVTTTAPNSASKILALIDIEESRLQKSYNDAYHEMAEKAFKGLRRALPLTRQKIDWDKVLGYKLGAELTAGKGVFTGS
ncbi:F-actin capping protein alpha subunit [Pisolithus marmoratus]|nr:F-actin capping protein alpha subunit [Pisolithus marmoratus]